MITLAEIQARADRYAAGANPEIEWEMSQDRVWLLERMAQLEAEMEQLHLVVDEYAKALARIATLESELTEAKLQRDSWKRIAESGLGIPAETDGECQEHEYTEGWDSHCKRCGHRGFAPPEKTEVQPK